MSDLGLRTFPGPILVSFLIPILVSGIYSKIACDNEMVACRARCLLPAAMPEHCPHVCCVKIMFGLLLTNSFVSTTMNSIKCLVNWIPQKIRVRSRNTQPYLKVVGAEAPSRRAPILSEENSSTLTPRDFAVWHSPPHRV